MLEILDIWRNLCAIYDIMMTWYKPSLKIHDENGWGDLVDWEAISGHRQDLPKKQELHTAQDIWCHLILMMTKVQRNKSMGSYSS